MDNVINFMAGEIYLPKENILIFLDKIYNRSFIHSFWVITPFNEYMVAMKNLKEKIECITLAKDVEAGFIKLSDYLDNAEFIGRTAKSLDGSEITILYRSSYISLIEVDSKYLLLSNDFIKENFMISPLDKLQEIDKTILSKNIYKQFLGKGRIK